MGKEKIDYAEIGFKCGLEIHQQLEGKKLFCQCSTANVQLKPDIFAERKLRAVVGETGIVDKAAAFEAAKGKLFLYKAHSSDCCLVELDEEPPHPINPDAVKIAVTVAKLLNAKLVDEIQVMRKIVIDGSNVTGFQRTALIALNGWIETSKGKVSIPTICLEEEAAQKIEESEKTTAYKLDRLGIPLIEIATGPEIKDPEHAKEVAEKLGLILRSVKGVKRGIGTIRQDVNLSIKGRARVEIKGFQDLDSIPKIIEYEVRRLLSLKERNEPEVRKANPDGTTSFLRPMPGAARLYPETDIPPFKVDFEVELPELIEEKIKRYEKLGLDRDLAKAIAKSKKSKLFDAALEKTKLKPGFVAEVIFSKP
ncbi:MAG TPA: Glu-tRNA(Gln) amidotransferase subunit GatE, partial [Candidatus Woesearchaeota archaeon]|nr:Glu-tRNA(Gln) amidotransferase subunit GatE [Candidatus Woesearchaeota archaeon]